MFNMIRKYVVFTNRLDRYYVISVVTQDTNLNMYFGNTIVGYRELQFNLG